MNFAKQIDHKERKFENSLDKTDPGQTRVRVDPVPKSSKPVDKKKGRKAIGNYTYHEDHIIGWGYTSKVYRGRTLDKSQPILTVAIKKIPITDLDNLHIGLLQNQVRIVKKLSHPNVVSVYDILYTKKNCYIVMELCEGGCLEKHLKKIESDEERVKILKDVSSAFQYLVKEGVVHRDIKPGNILRTKAGDWKLADFGFAVEISQALKDDKISVGTPIYMAPQSLEHRKYSFKSDIFSLGIVFHQIINSGKLLWFQKTKKKIFQAIMKFDMSEVDVQKPFSRSVLMKMLDPNPETRIAPEKITVANLVESTILQNPNQEMIEDSVSQEVSYDSVLKREEIKELQLTVSTLLNEERLLGMEEGGLQLYSSLKILKEALQMQTETTTMTSVYSRNSLALSASKPDFNRASNKYTIAKVTNPFTLEFLHYVSDLVEKILTRIPEERLSLDLKNVEAMKLCYKKLSGKYILSPTNTANRAFNFSTNSFGSQNCELATLNMRESLINCKNYVQILILGNQRINRLSLGAPPDLRKVFSENVLKARIY